MAVESVKDVFETAIAGTLKEKPELVDQIAAVYKFIVTGDGAATWVVDLTTAGGKISEGDGEGDCTLTIAGSDLMDIVNGKLNGQMAFMTGKLKVDGDMSLAMKLGSLLG